MTSKHTPGPWANASLIAAAPDMYEALRAGDALISGELTGAEWKRACQDFTRMARAALDKAEGKP